MHHANAECRKCGLSIVHRWADSGPSVCEFCENKSARKRSNLIEMRAHRAEWITMRRHGGASWAAIAEAEGVTPHRVKEIYDGHWRRMHAKAQRDAPWSDSPPHGSPSGGVR